ncbi:hypothetical protein F9C28_06575 [Shimwellia pseudoproteus]|uniref:hypothetical protein n=1 Tax=Shimwellia pseudoproteus TaxID=570012 RepID=UPI0018EA5D13|nr:hypothetical protein [Shimwellia pseudoproteus]MBJ3814597.1 hypothetical protein [Shimwellia pseudoproteus]
MLNTLNRVENTINTRGIGALPHEYCHDKLIQWAAESMAEGLPDKFFQARLLCAKFPDMTEPGSTVLCAYHDVKLTPHSDYEDFNPADDAYPARCIEALLEGKEWVEALVVFDRESVSFEWR